MTRRVRSAGASSYVACRPFVCVVCVCGCGCLCVCGGGSSYVACHACIFPESVCVREGQAPHAHKAHRHTHPPSPTNKLTTWMLMSDEARLPCVRRTRLGRDVVPDVCMYMTGWAGGGGGGSAVAGGCGWVDGF